MRVPSDVAAAIASGHTLGFSCSGDGTVTTGFEPGWGGGAYPPPGYLPWNILDVGNGDNYGYYWAIGREGDPPIVCTIMHDAWALLPVASSLGACIRLHLLADQGDQDELIEAANAFGVDIRGIPLQPQNDEPFSLDGPPWTNSESSGIEFWGVPSVADLLSHDPESPHLRLVAAKDAIAKRQPGEAEHHLKLALARLPEYAEALALLAQVYRQQQDQCRTAEALMEAITSPQCFGAWERKKLLTWLQRLPDDAGAACGDPLWKRRHALTFAEGVKENDDYRVLEGLIEEYHRRGLGVRAVRLRMLTREWMHRETVSFRERYDWTDQSHRTSLKADLERAGLHDRLRAIK